MKMDSLLALGVYGSSVQQISFFRRSVARERHELTLLASVREDGGTMRSNNT